MGLPLEGIRIIDFSRAVAGPYATMLLGDLGADVIKIEELTGELSRTLGPPFVPGKPGERGESAYYLSVNRNKRSLALNIKSPEGRKIVEQLVCNSDILIENFRPGTMYKLGLDLERLRSLNAKLITCSISGYGSTGENAGKGAFDFVIQAESGLMSITGEPDGEPMKLGVAVTDVTTGMMATVALLTALRERDRSGKGQHIELALLDTTLAWLINVGQNYLVSKKRPKRYGNAHPNIVPYQIFRTLDGYFAVSGGGDQHFKRLCVLLGIPELAHDPRFATNPDRLEHREELISILEEQFIQNTTDAWDEAFRHAGIPGGRVNGVDQILESSHIKERGLIWEIDHPTAGKIPVIGNPIRFSDIPLNKRQHPPLLGEHTDEILKELNYRVDEIQQLRKEGIVL